MSAEEFLRLSERLTGRAELDRRCAGIYRDALVASPGNMPLLRQLASGAERGPAHVALEATIVEWWYTGVCTVDGQPRVAAYGDALMWSALRVPAPGMCAGEFGAWAKPPSSLS